MFFSSKCLPPIHHPFVHPFVNPSSTRSSFCGTHNTKQVNDAPVSWCKVEVAAQSPKSITRLLAEEVAAEAAAAAGVEAAAAAAAACKEDESASSPSPSSLSPSPHKKASASTGKLPPAPPVVTMSLSMKTVVSPRTHTHEVVALSALVHREVRLDGASDEDGNKVLVRVFSEMCSF